MTRRYSSHAIALAKLLREMNPDIKLAPALEKQLGKKHRTVDVAPKSATEISNAELDADIGQLYPDLPFRG